MCIEFYARVLSREGDTVVVDCDGRRRRASTLLIPDVSVGEWVLVAAGTLVERVDATEAQQVNQMLQDAQRTLQ